MRHILLLLLLVVSSITLAQEPGYNRSSSVEFAELRFDEIESEVPDMFGLTIDDVDDIAAALSISASMEFYTSVIDLFDLGMMTSRYERMTELEPLPLCDIYCFEGSSRFISAGLRLTF